MYCHNLPYCPYCNTAILRYNHQEIHFDSATYLSSFPLIIDVVEQGLTAGFLPQTAIRTLESILHQKIHRKLYVPDDFPLASPGASPASKPTNSQPQKGHIDSIKARQITQGKKKKKGQFTAKLFHSGHCCAGAYLYRKARFFDVAYDKRRGCVARPLPYPSYFNISLPPLLNARFLLNSNFPHILLL